MKKIFLMGRSEAGKTSLTQALKGEELHYIKTQYTNSNDDTIDSPGEYAESKRFSVGLACFSFEADVVAIVQAADEPFNLFGASCRSFILRPLIGIITKIDSPYANIPMVRQWLINAGCERIFMVNNVTREGIDAGGYPEAYIGTGEIQTEPWSERVGSSSRGSGLSGRKREYAIKNSHSDFPVIWMGIFIWYVAYVNYGIKEMYRFNRQRVSSFGRSDW